MTTAATQDADGPTYAPSRREAARFSHNRSLDGLRALAVLLVVVSHGTTRLTAPDQRFGAGAIGVGVFFVLSGYLITSLLLRERAASGRINLRHFYVRRALRIWPLYYAVLLLHLLVLARIDASRFGGTWLSNESPAYDDLPAVAWSYFVFAQNYVATVEQVRLGLGVYWSLAIEEQYYLIWPVVVIALTKHRGCWRLAIPAVLVTAIALSLITRAATIDGHLPTAPAGVEWMAHTNLFGLAVGALLAWMHWDADLAGRSRAGGGTFGAWLGWTVLAAMVFSRWVPAIDRGLTIELPNAEYYEPLLLSLAVAAIVDRAVSREWRWSPLRWVPLVYVGRVSFGVYLLHPIILGIVSGLGGRGWFEMFLYVLLSVAVAALSYEFFEKRLLRYKARFSHVRA